MIAPQPPSRARGRYGDATTYAYGKRERLRDAGLWAMDGADYYSGRYLQLTTSAARLLSPDKAELLLPEVTDAHHCVRSHLRLSALQRQWLQDAFLLAAATNRVLVLPPIWCMLDRFWTILNHCLIGSQASDTRRPHAAATHGHGGMGAWGHGGMGHGHGHEDMDMGIGT